MIDFAVAAGMTHRYCRLLRIRLRAIWRFAYRVGTIEKAPPAPARQPPMARTCKRIARDGSRPEAPDAESGTVLHFYRTAYRPQQLIDATPDSRGDFERTFRYMRRTFGRDVLLSDLCDSLAAEFLGNLKTRGLKPKTINGHRARLLAVWRFGCDRDQVAVLPRIKKLKEHLDEPDAWTEGEASRIIKAAEQLEMPPISGIPANEFWRALLLVGYWTALRRGSLFALLRADVDLSTGLLYVRPTGIKNRHGKSFYLGADAIEAVGQIWTPERELIFPWDRNTSTTRAYFGKILEIAGVSAGRRKGMNQLHKWRRTVATLVTARAGLPAAVALLGHSGDQVTKRYVDPRMIPGHDARQILPRLG